MIHTPCFVFRTLIGVVALLAAATGAVSGQEPGPQADIARQAYDLLKKKCYQCHGVQRKADLVVLDRDVLTRDRGSDLSRFVTAGKPDDSLIWHVIDSDYMPPRDKLTGAEKSILQNWIAAGAAFPEITVVVRPFVSNLEALSAIHDYLNRIPVQSRASIKFFTLTHLHNNRSGAVQEETLQITRAGLSKALNSLTKSNGIVLPTAVDTHRTIYAIDINDFGWTPAQWRKLLSRYPYGMSPRSNDEKEVYEKIEGLLGGAADFDRVVSVRADWFVATATDGSAVDANGDSLYDELLGLPKTLDVLETQLGVARNSDFTKVNDGTGGAFQMLRGGVLRSGVSSQNRVIDVHQASGRVGWYWISYDFNRESEKGNIVTHPLGPDFAAHPFKNDAFDAAGSEVIFRLPNGLHGYFLVDKDGKRIGAGPINVVADDLRTSGTPQIVNGLSCMGCHQHGMVRFNDELGKSHALQNAGPQRLAASLFNNAKLQARLKDSSSDYERSLEAAIQPFFESNGRFDLDKVPEPVSAVARRYQADLDIHAVAAELSMPAEGDGGLKAAIPNNLALKRLGFELLQNDRTLKRTMLTALSRGKSRLQQAGQALNLFDPEVVGAPAGQ